MENTSSTQHELSTPLLPVDIRSDESVYPMHANKLSVDQQHSLVDFTNVDVVAPSAANVGGLSTSSSTINVDHHLSSSIGATVGNSSTTHPFDNPYEHFQRMVKQSQTFVQDSIITVRYHSQRLAKHISMDDLIYVSVFFTPMIVLYLMSHLLRTLFENMYAPPVDPLHSQTAWITGHDKIEKSMLPLKITLFLNTFSYLTVLVPGYLLLQYIRTQAAKKPPNAPLSGVFDGILRLYAFGSTKGSGVQSTGASLESGSSRGATLEGMPMGDVNDVPDRGLPSVLNSLPFVQQMNSDSVLIVNLCVCFAGLLSSYLTWGLLQERIMTQSYTDVNGTSRKFQDSQFLVFANRILAFALALLYIALTRQSKQQAPIFKFSFCSISNILSSWFQYEALKYISFPAQVLTKASKIIPVMIMGKFVSRKTYQQYEYIVAALITSGMAFFLFGTSDSTPKVPEKNVFGPNANYQQLVDEANTSSGSGFVGIILLLGYMTSDSFTSTYQSRLFTEFRSMSSVQMMAGVNFISVLVTGISILQTGSLFNSLSFMSQFPTFATDCFLLSICSAVGQLFIFFTINEFGAVIFTIIMTLRQAVAILLSCYVYGHSIGFLGFLGISMVFGGVAFKIYGKQVFSSSHTNSSPYSSLSATAPGPATSSTSNHNEHGSSGAA